MSIAERGGLIAARTRSDGSVELPFEHGPSVHTETQHPLEGGTKRHAYTAYELAILIA